MTNAPAAARAAASGIRNFRNAHAGRTIVVCGCGESLKELSSPQRHITIGVNDVGRLFDTTYLVVVNPRSQFKGDRFGYVERSGAQALFTQLELGRVRPPVVRFKLGQYGGTDFGAADTLHYTQNSPYVAVCLAAYMGACRIGLIGVDFTEHHFFARTGRHSLAGRVAEIDAQYGRLGAALARRGIELVNLSPVSRLASLERARVDEDGVWSKCVARRPASAVRDERALPLRSSAMKVCVEKRSGVIIGQLLDAFAGTIAELGHAVVRDPRAHIHDRRALSVVWNGRGFRGMGPTLYCEHGWLPRSSYQISPRGINAGSHIAPFTWDGAVLDAEADAALEVHLGAIKSATYSGYNQYMDAGKNAAVRLPPAFLLVPLQMEYDTNLVHHAPAHLRTMQALVDHVSALNPPWPVIFKQHPMDVIRGNRHLRLRLRRRQDMLWPQARGNIHQMLKSGACRGIVTVNSNVAHDGLLWNVPGVVLGRNVWPTKGEVTPFLTEIPRDWSALGASVAEPRALACRRAYMHFLMRHQWTLADARQPQKVAALLESALGDRNGSAAGVRVPAPALRPRVVRPIVNVVAENRGWLFEAWKRRIASLRRAAIEVAASDRPLRHADAWIFIRAREAGASPDPSRTVVQLHDLFDGGLYRRGGARFAVRACGAISMTHPSQRDILAASGIDTARVPHIVQPVGWGSLDEARHEPGAAPTVAWVGRPAWHDGDDTAGLALFVEAARGLRRGARVMLIGERLGEAARMLQRAGVDCAVHGLARFPLAYACRWIGAFDCLAITASADTGPWPLFDALRACVPVVSVRTGWAAELLADGSGGRLVDGAESMRAAIEESWNVRGRRRAPPAEFDSRLSPFSTDAWVEANLDLATSLVRQAPRQAT